MPRGLVIIGRESDFLYYFLRLLKDRNRLALSGTAVVSP
jgi:hypothetical protein